MPDTSLGFHRLAQLHGVALVQPLFTRSRLGAVRKHEVADRHEIRTWPAQYQPANSFRGHFEFGLKYERLNFEFFSRLFARINPEEVAAWVRDEPIPLHTSPRFAELSGVAGAFDEDGHLLQAQP